MTRMDFIRQLCAIIEPDSHRPWPPTWAATGKGAMVRTAHGTFVVPNDMQEACAARYRRFADAWHEAETTPTNDDCPPF